MLYPPHTLSSKVSRTFMSRIVFDFLLDSFLMDEEAIAELYRKFSDEEIRKELNRYRDYIGKNIADLEAHATQLCSPLKVVAPKKTPDINLLKQSALFLDQYVVDDPVYQVGYEPSSTSKVFSRYLGLTETNIDRSRVAQAVAYIRAVRPFVTGNFLKLFPFSSVFEGSSEIPFRVSDNQFADALPANVLNWLRPRARVHPIRIRDGTMVMHPPQRALSPTRLIQVTFDPNDPELGEGFQLVQQDITGVHEDLRTFTARVVMPEEPPSRAEFQAWITQSINHAAEKVYNTAMAEQTIAARLGASHLTTAPIIFDLLRHTYHVVHHPTTETLNTFVQLQLPFMARIEPERLMDIRLNEAEAFHKFRVSLIRRLEECDHVQDAASARRVSREINREFGEDHLEAVKEELATLRKKVAPETVVALGSLALALLSSGSAAVFGGIVAAGSVWKFVVDSRTAIRKPPGFFLWKVLGKKGRKA
jgi:hypothetical protein